MLYYLENEQIKRLYDIYGFNEKEEIVNAYIDNDELSIQYIDKNDVLGCYEPRFEIFTNKEDFHKLKYILWGEE